MNRHTPGPWRIVDLRHQKNGKIKIFGDTVDIANVLVRPLYKMPGSINDALRMALDNALLIAASPELLKAGRAAYDMLCIAVDTNGGDSKTHSGCEDLRKAIAKAEGRSA